MALDFRIPHISSKFLDENGQVSREWWLFMSGMLQIVGGPTINANLSPLVPINLSLTSGVIGVLTVPSGGTGISSTAVNALLYAPSANTVSSLAVGNSSLLASSAGGVPLWTTSLPSFMVTTLTAANVVGTTISAVTVSAAGVSTNSISAITVSATTVTTGTLAVNGNQLTFSIGTFTPTIVGSATAGTGTYTTQQGNYTRIGDRCFFNLRVTWTATTGTGNTLVGGLPFISNATANSNSALPVYTNLGIALATSYIGFVNTGATTIVIFNTAAGVGDGATALQASGDLIIAGSYLL